MQFSVEKFMDTPRWQLSKFKLPKATDNFSEDFEENKMYCYRGIYKARVKIFLNFYSYNTIVF